MSEILPVTSMISPAMEMFRKNRWIIEWEGLDAWTLKTFARPNLQFGEVVQDFINTKVYFQGKFEWSTIEMSLYQPLVPSAQQRVMEWVRLGYENISGRAGYKEFYTAKNFKLKLLDPVGAVMEQWDFINLFLTAVNNDSLDYGSADILMSTLTLRYDKCILQR